MSHRNALQTKTPFAPPFFRVRRKYFFSSEEKVFLRTGKKTAFQWCFCEKGWFFCALFVQNSQFNVTMSRRNAL